MAIAALLSGMLNIWVVSPLEAMVQGDSCMEGKFVGEFVVLIICLGLIVAGSVGLWQMREWSMVPTKRQALLFLICTTTMTSGGMWLFETVTDIILCLTFTGWSAR